MTFPTEISDHHKENLTQKCIYLVSQFKSKDMAMWEKYNTRLETLKPEDSWDFFHEMLVEYQKLTETPAIIKSVANKSAKIVKKIQQVIAPAKKALIKVTTKKSVAKKAVAKKEVVKAPVAKKSVTKKVTTKKVTAKKATSKKVAAKKPAVKKAAPKKALAKKAVKKPMAAKKITAKKSFKRK